MNLKITLLILIFLNLSAVVAQVKVGDNPNQIDANSLLELESSNKVLVLSRVTTSQMNAITPLNGALVYNTDQNCVYQFTGSVWESLCSIIETTTVVFDNNDGTFSYTNEAGATISISKALLTNNGDGTFTFDNGNGAPINFVGTDNQTATEVAFDDTNSGLGETDVQGAIDALAAANSDDQNLSEVLTEGNNAGGVVIDNIGTPVDGNDATTKDYVDTAIAASDAADNDTDNTNEVNTAFAVNGTNLEITDSANTLQVPLADIDNQNATEVNLNTPIDVDGDTVNELTVEEAIADLAAASSDNQTAAEVAFDDTNSSLGETDVQGAIDALAASNAADNDTDDTNEVNTAFAVNGTNLEITDSANTLQVPLADIDNQNATEVNLNTPIDVDGDTVNELTVEEAIADLAAASSDNQTAAEVAFDDTNSSLGETDVQGAIDALAASNAADNDTDDTNEVNTAFAVNGTNLEITDSANTLQVPLADIDNQTAAEVAFTPTGNTTSTDVQAAIEEIQTEVDGFAAVAGEDNTASNVGNAGVGTFKQKDGVDLEFKNINSASGKITVTDDIANDEIDLEISANAITTNELADNAVTTAKIANDAVTTDKILDGTIASADIASGGNDKILTTNATGVVTWEDKAALDTDATNEIQNINEVLADGNNAGGLVIDNIGTPVDGNDATTKDYVDTAIAASDAADNDTDDTNEVNTAFAVNGTNLEITDSANTLQVPLADIDNQTAAEVAFDDTNSGLGETDVQGAIDALAAANSDDQNLSEVLTEGNNAGGVVIDNIGTPVDGNDATTKDYVDTAIAASDAADNDTDDTNEVNTAFAVNGTNLEITDSANTLQVPLADIDNQTAAEVAFDDTNSGLGETDVQGAIDALAASNAADNDTDDTNEVNTAFAVNGTNLEITDSANTLQVPLADIDNQNATEVNLNTPIDVDGDTVNELTVEEAIADLAAASSDNQTAAEVAFDDTNSGLGETDVQGAIDALAASNAADNDTDDTNEVNTAFAVNGTNLEITDSANTLQVPLADIDNQNATEVNLNTPIDVDGDTVNELTVEEAIADLAAASSDNQTAAEVAFDDTNSSLGETDVQGAIDALAASNAADNDTDDTNEVNTAFAVNGTNLEITDSANTLQVPLADIDNQTAAEVAFTPTGNTISTDVQAAIEEIQTEVDGFAAVAGEDNTASNVGNAGVGTFKQKDGVDLEFKNINSASGKITVTDDIANDEIDLEISANAITTNELADNAVTTAKIANDAVTTDKILDGTIASADIASGGNDKILTTNATGVVTWEDKAALDTDATNEIQNINEVLADGNNAGGLVIDNIGTPVDGNDATTKDYVDTAIAASDAADNDTDDTNEVNTAFAVNGTNLEITDSANTLQVPLADIDNQTAAEVAFDDTNSGLGETDVQGAIDALAASNAADNDTDDTNEVNTAFAVNGTNLEITDSANTLQVPLADIDNQNATEVAFDDTNSGLGETDVQGAIDALAASNAADNDTDDTNEVNTAFAVNGTNLEITDSANTLQVPLADIDNQNATEVSLNTPIDVDGDTVNELTVEEAIADLTAASSDNQTAAEVAFTPTGNTTSTDVQAAIEEIQTEVDGFAAVAGEDNTASNVGNAGVGTFKQKDGVDLEFKNINSASGKITVTDDIANDEIDLEISANAITTNELADNAVTTAKIANDAVTTDKILDGTIASADIASGGNDKILTTNATGVVTWEDKAALDTDATNEIQNINEVLADGNNAGGLVIDNIGTPVDGNDATTKDYVDTAIAASDAADNDTDDTNEVNTAFAVNGTNLEITDSANTLQVPLADIDNQTAAEVAFDDTNSGLGETDVQGAIDALAASNAADNDTDDTNEVNTAFAVNGTNLEITDSANTLQVPLADIDNQNATEVAFDDTNSGLGETDVQGAIDALAASNAADNDTDDTNEVNTAFAVNGTNLEITDSANTLQVPLADIDNQNATEVNLNTPIDVDGDTVNELTVEEAIADLAAASSDNQTAAEVAFDDTNSSLGETDVQGAIDALAASNAADNDTDDTNEVNTAFAVNGTNLEITDSANTLQVPLADIDNQTAAEVAFTPTGNTTSTDVQAAIEEIQTEVDGFAATSGQTNTASNVGNAGIGVFARKTGVDLQFKNINAGSNRITVSDAATDNINIDVNEANIRITESQITDLAHTVDTDDQNLSEVLTEGNNAGGVIIDNIGTPVDGNDATTKDYVDTAIAASDAADNDTDDTNEVNTAFAVNGTNLEITDSANTLQVPLADIDNQTAVEVAFDDTNSGLGETDVQGAIDALAASNAADNDTDDTNEVNTAFAVNGTNLEITDSASTLQVPLADIDNQTAVEVAFDDTNSSLGETDVQGAIDALAASNAADNDTDDTNEVNTAFAVNGTNLEITDSANTLQVPLADIDNQTAAEVAFDDTNSSLGETDVQGAIDALAASNAADNDTDDTNEVNTAFAVNGTNLEITDSANTLQVPLADIDNQTAAEVAFDDTNSGLGETDVQGAIDALAASNAADNDTDDTNEVNTAFAVNGTNLEITDSANTLQVPLADIDNQNATEVNLNTPIDVDGDSVNELTVEEAIADLAAASSDNQTAAEVAFDDTNSGLGETDVQGAIDALAASNAADNDTDDTNEVNTAFAVNGTNLEITDSANTLQVPLADIDNQTAAEVAFDDTNSGLGETDVQGAIDALAASNAADNDTDATNEVNTAFAVNGTNLEITDSANTLQVPLADIDNQTAAEVAFDDTNSGLGETDVQGAIDTLAASNAADNDTDDTNEVNTAFAVNGTNLEITDSANTLQVPLADIDNQNATEVNLNTPIDVDGDTVNELTVEEAIADLAAASSDNQTAAEVAFDDTNSGLGETDVQGAIDALAASNAADNDTDATNEIQVLSKTGTTISLSNGGGSVDETVTTFAQNDSSTTGEITYTNEAGTATTAQVVSANTGNQVTVGTDGGAFFASPVKAIGKVLGTGVAAKIRNATVSRINEGDYQITFASAMPDANYIIQLSIIDCGGDCPGNSTANYDDAGITYYDQQTTGFKVNIGDSDNGTTQKDDIDLEFMFTVLDF
ncbi:beta strand repeat-containing protein [Aquimarina sp. W85]|uniref:beta strand repeat-containing protein n=1 Tax=Aquimarina rhodophyticola TaxID=3342246 RepID=UPI003671A406